MTAKAKQIALIVVVFFAGAAVGCGVTYTYFMSQVFNIEMEIR